jgi:type I restriction enzyme, S subunit
MGGNRSQFRSTDVGIFPADWDIVPLSELLTEFRGGAPLKPTDLTPTGIAVLSKGGVGQTGWLQIADDDLKYCSPQYAARHRNNQVDQSYTIVVLRDPVPSGPSIGLIVQIEERETYVLAQGVYGFKLNNRVEARYLVYLSNTGWYRQLMNAIMVGSTQVHITNTAFKQVKIPLPPIKEQHIISSALSEVDELIRTLGRLIAKKRDLKQAAMQQLLTGRTRLPGFDGEWNVKSLGELFSITSGTSKSAFVTAEGDYWICDMGSVSTDGRLIVSKRTNYRGDFLASGDLVMPKDDIGGGKIIGKIGYIDAEQTYILSDHVCCLRPREGDSRFLAYKINSRETNAALRKKVIGSAQLGLSRKSVEEQEIRIPSPSEQTAIATILSDMDAELVTLKARREY